MAKRTHWRTIFTGTAVFLAVVLAVLFTVPHQETRVGSDLENVARELVKAKEQAEVAQLQHNLAPGEEAVEVYDQPTYVEVTDTCNWAFAGDCVKVRTGPGREYPEAFIYYATQGPFPARVRQGQVFSVSSLVRAMDGSLWYQVAFDKNHMLFPGRIRSSWYLSADHFAPVDFTPIDPDADTQKRIVVVLHEQMLYAYEGETLFMKTAISSGESRLGLATDTGQFHVFQKDPMAVMEGPLPGMESLVTPQNIANFEYTLFVPFAMAFESTAAGTSFIHEAYWHHGFGTERSHGCINVDIQDALRLYNWTPDPSTLQIPVTVLP